MKRIKGTNKNTKECVYFKSLKEAASTLKITVANISSNIAGKRKSAGGWIWEEVEDEEYDTNVENETFDYEIDKHGKITNWSGNIEIWLKSHFHSFRFNEFTYNCELDGNPLTDDSILTLNHLMDMEIHVSLPQKLKESILYLCKKDSYNPEIEWLEELQWDGISRIHRYFTDVLGAIEDPLKLNEKKSTNFWISMIQRITHPGCMLRPAMWIIIDQTPNTGKTTNFDVITGGKTVKMNANALRNDDKDTRIKILGKTILNFDELKGFSTDTWDALKSFLTETHINVRLPYKSKDVSYPAQFVCVGTSNFYHILRDMTTIFENRFTIVDCNGRERSKEEWDDLMTEEYIEQLHAEAYEMFKQYNGPIEYTQEEKKYMEQEHASHKAFNNDVDVKAKLDSILKREYSIQALKDYHTFIAELKTKFYEGTAKIEKIPLDWIVSYLNRSEMYVCLLIAQYKHWSIIEEDDPEKTTKTKYLIREKENSIFNQVVENEINNFIK